MKWKKLGLIFSPSGAFDWMRSHATLPIAEHLEGNLFRIYFSSRDTQQKSYLCSIVINIEEPQKVLEFSDKPLLSPGELGAFDDSGAMATWLVNYQNKKYLYYVGWNLGVTVPFRNSIGLAIEDQNGEYIRYATGPIVDRTMSEPHFCASCAVLPSEDTWQMWYLSCVGWRVRNGKPEHRYHIKYAESKDGIHWDREGIVAIEFTNDEEYAISRPSVIKDSDCYRMWFSYRGDRYRIGYAESQDGKQWTRMDDKVGIDTSSSGWDSEMVEYPFVFDHKGSRYMLYNGNGYGKTGFGLAVLEQ